MSQPPGASAFPSCVNLAAEALGARAVACSDDFFAEMDNLIKPGRGVFLPDEYTDRGKWMDGWESRRKRVPGHDWCILKLGAPGVIRGVDIDTNHFLGNHAPFASIDACVAPADADAETLEEADWTPILEQVALQRGSQNISAVQSDQVWSHLRLNIYPAGGVARLKVYGLPTASSGVGHHDLAALLNGGRALACSDMFFSSMNNLLLPFEAENMGGGWETRRSRPPGEDWVIIALGQTGRVDEVVVDTRHFKGNYPDRCRVEGICWPGAPASMLIQSPDWEPLTASVKLHADMPHMLRLTGGPVVSHLRLRILPDGGVSRFRAVGEPASPPEDPLTQWLREGEADAVAEALARCCGAERWVDGMLAIRERVVTRAALYGEAEWLWWHLAEVDWREAFRHHPRIGADVEKLREKFAPTATWSEGEQSGVQEADEATLRALAKGNAEYQLRFGHIFIVCASGLSAAEMLERLRERMHNEADAELRIAAGEQARITRLRLDKLEVPS